MPAVQAFDEVADFIAGTDPHRVSEFEMSAALKRRIASLIRREKTVGLSASETEELNHFMELDQVMSLAKARARGLLCVER